MNTFFKFISLCLVANVVLISCNDKDDEIIAPEAPVAAQFSSGIQVTRAADNYWDAGDMIGIYMIRNNYGIKTVVEGVDNRAYETLNGDGIFTPVSETIYYPIEGNTNLDFIAYYPYREEIETFPVLGRYYPVNIKDQSSQEAIDLLYANNATGHNKSNPNVKLIFEHKLAKITFNISAGDGLQESDLEGLKLTIKGIKTEAYFYLFSGTLVDLDMISAGNINAKAQADGQFAEAIIVPGRPSLFTMTYEFYLPQLDKTYKYTVDKETPFESGTKTIYNVVLGKVEADITGEIANWDEQPEKELDLK